MNEYYEITNKLFICPITHKPLRPVDKSRLNKLRCLFDEYRLVLPNDIEIGDSIDYALISEDGLYIYPVIDDIFFLVPSMAITVRGEDFFINTFNELTSSTIEETRLFYDEYGWKKSSSQDIYYDSALFEDLRPVSANYINKCHLRINRYFDNLGKLLLDIASGPVQYDEYMTYSMNFDYRICADISLRALKEAKNKMKDRGIYLLCDITNIPIKKESMDSVVSLHTLYHVPLDQQKKALNEIYRVLRPESTGVIVYSWGSTSILMKVNFLHDLYCAVKKIILNLFGGKKEIELSKDNILKEPKLYYRVHNFKWFIENINIKFKFELGSWRSVDVKFLKFFIHDFLFGRLILRIIFRLEEVFPKFFGRYGQYPILILKK